jgi:Ca-activated chloride channel homolog
LSIDAVIQGFTADVTANLTFHNAKNRQLETELRLPLPSSAVVYAFGFSQPGGFIDAALVPKEEARVAFEAEVRKGQATALAEHVKGNAFSTRVYDGSLSLALQSACSHADDRGCIALLL